MRKALFALLCALALAAHPAVPKIVFDTDMVEDYDDVGAMACLHALADEGKCEILAMATCTRDNQSVAAVEVLNAFYGRPDIPVGCAKGMGVVGVPGGDPKRPGHMKFTRLAKEYAEWVKHPNSNDAPDANEVYRRALASAPDRSVVFCSVGFITNMRRLLETKPDAISPLDGRALVAKKVREWHVMACRAPKGREYNAMHDGPSTKIAFEQWPTPVVVSDWDLGRHIYAGRAVAERTYAYRNPVHDLFAWSLPSREAVRAGKAEEKEEGGRCSWDEATVLSAVYGANHFFDTERGTFAIGEDGSSTWTLDGEGRFLRLVPADRREHRIYTRRHVGGILDELIAREPKCRRTDEGIAAFRRSALERTATGVRMLRDGKTLWNLEIDNPEGRPFFHPLMLPGGRPLTDLRPKDHVWHLGYWFSWKYVNGVNYWEPADGKRQGAEPAGRTHVAWKRVTTNGLDCVVELKLLYGPRGEKDPVLVENRCIEIDPPDPKGGYAITVRHRFEARRDAVLDRTPPHGDVKKGKWGGGYAGATLRLDPAFAKASAVRGFAGGDSPAACTGAETKFLDFTDPATGEGATFSQIQAPASAKFYLWPDKRMVNPSPVYDGPVALKKGETLELAYRLAVHASRQVATGEEPKVRPVERMDRGLVASVSPRGTHVGWRLLDTDAPDASFDLWRRDLGWNIEMGIWYSPFIVADLFGDWREEFITGHRGEIRIYTTDIPAMDRRVSLMRDPSYRSRVTMWPSGYDQQPILRYVPSAVSPNVSVRFAGNARRVRLDVTAPRDRPLKGELKVEMPEKWSVAFDGRIDLPPGGVWSKDLPIRRPPNPRGRYDATATLTRPDGPPLVVHQPLVM